MPPKKGKGCGKRMQPEPESNVTSVYDVVRETEPETKDFGGESVEQAAFNKKKVPELEPAVEQAIVVWFADHPLFYDMSDANIKNRQRKDRLLDQKGKELNMSGKYVGYSYPNIRMLQLRNYHTLFYVFPSIYDLFVLYLQRNSWPSGGSHRGPCMGDCSRRRVARRRHV